MSSKSGQTLAAVEWSPGYARTAIPGQGVSQGVPSGWAHVRACLSRRNTFIRAIRIPNVSGGEAEKILKLQAPQAFPIPGDDLVFTYRLTHDISPEGRLAVIAATRGEVIRGLHESLRSMGVKAEEVVPAAFGSMLLAKSMGLKNTAVIEKEPEGWSIDLIVDGELRYSRVIPAETDRAALESEVCRTFGMAGLPCGSILTAGGALLNFSDASTEHSTLESLTKAEVGALGVQLELPEVLIAREKRLIGNRARLAAVLWVSAAALGIYVGGARVERADDVRKYESQFMSGSRKLKIARDAAQTKLSGITKTAETLERAFKPAQKSSDVLSLVSSLAPQGVWLTGMTFERGKPLTVRGAATNSNSVAAYLDALSNNERFRDVKLVFSNDATIETTKVSQFSISIHAIGNLPLLEAKTKGRAPSR